MSKRVTDLLPSTKGGFLTNKWILYLVLFFAVFDVFHFYQKGDVQSVMIFFVVGILISFFSKNMVVILILAIVITHLIRYGKQLTEGFEEDREEFDDEEKEGFEDDDDKEKFEDDDDKEKFEDDDDKEKFEDEETEKTKKPKEEESFQSAMDAVKKTNDSVNQMAAAASSAGDLSQQTKELLTTQKTLMENMKTLEPLLNKADTFLSKNKEPFTSLAEAYPNKK